MIFWQTPAHERECCYGFGLWNRNRRGAAHLHGAGRIHEPLVDPDSRFDSQQKQTDQNGRTVIQNGNTSLRFGGSSSANQNYNPNNMFDPFYRDGR